MFIDRAMATAQFLKKIDQQLNSQKYLRGSASLPSCSEGPTSYRPLTAASARAHLSDRLSGVGWETDGALSGMGRISSQWIDENSTTIKVTQNPNIT